MAAPMPPAYLFVVRHGNRLDAADNKWHLTSPTPYDPPLTYGGFLQARQVGNQIAQFLEQAKLEVEDGTNGDQSTSKKKRRRFRVVIHTSPFLRCVQTSIGISSGLAQTSPYSAFSPADIIVPHAVPSSKPFSFKSTLLRLDPFLGEWLSPEYFEMITPPPRPALMLGGAKADLLRREHYSLHVDASQPQQEKAPSAGALWQATPTSSPSGELRSLVSENNGACMTLSAVASALSTRSDINRGYLAPRSMYAVSGSGRIPDGFAAHALDACVMVDYQWDSMREPLDFGDGGEFGEEWMTMHKRFRGGLRKLLNWYATTDRPGELSSKPAVPGGTGAGAGGGGEGTERKAEEEEVETIVIIVSHGAGCNALIGAITHQPVLMDVALASITMATRKLGLDYQQLLAAAEDANQEDPSGTRFVRVDKMYDLRLSASTEHLQSTSSTPVTSRAPSTAQLASNVFGHGSRGRTSTLGSSGVPVLRPFAYSSDLLSSPGSRSTSSASAAFGTSSSSRRPTGPDRPPPRGAANRASTTPSVGGGTGSGAVGSGLWSPMPSSLRLIDDNSDESDDFGAHFPNFDQSKFTARPVGDTSPTTTTGTTTAEPPPPAHDGAQSRPSPNPSIGASSPVASPRVPGSGNIIFAGPIRLHTSFGGDRPADEVKVSQLGGGLGGLWGRPPPPDEAERIRDLSQTKRRWTVNERP